MMPAGTMPRIFPYACGGVVFYAQRMKKYIEIMQ
jgi:hypothetical protein